MIGTLALYAAAGFGIVTVVALVDELVEKWERRSRSAAWRRLRREQRAGLRDIAWGDAYAARSATVVSTQPDPEGGTE